MNQYMRMYPTLINSKEVDDIIISITTLLFRASVIEASRFEKTVPYKVSQ